MTEQEPTVGRLRLGLSRFRVGKHPEAPPETQEPVTSAGRLDFPEPGTIFAGPIVLSGWAAFATGPTARVEAWLDEIPLGRARLGLPRPDVGAACDAPNAAVAGFELRASRDAYPKLAAGESFLRVVATSIAGEEHELGSIPVLLEEAPTPEAASASYPAAATMGGKGLRVLVFTNVLTLGGASLYLFDLLREARKQDRIDPTVVTAVDGPLRSELERLGVGVHVASPSSFEDLVSYLGRIEELAAWARPEDFELVLINTTSEYTVIGGGVAARLGIPAAWAIHESFELSELWGGLGLDVRAHAKATLSGAALAIFEAEQTRQMYQRVLEDRLCETLPYGLDLTPIEQSRAGFERDKARREADIPIDAELVLCVGTVEPRKGQIPLTLAFEQITKRHPRAHLAFVGVDAARPDSLTLAERVAASPVSERIRLIPPIEDVQPWYGMADLLVCASDIESLPRTVLEAMAWETPVLATDVFGLSELIDDGETGWLCDPRDVAALTAGLDRALGATVAERQRIGAAARALVEKRHALGVYAHRVADLLDEVARESSATD